MSFFQLPNKASGSSTFAREWNKMRECIQRLIPVQSANTQTQVTTMGTVRKGNARGKGGGTTPEFVWL
jgi:hypothetical protein